MRMARMCCWMKRSDGGCAMVAQGRHVERTAGTGKYLDGAAGEVVCVYGCVKGERGVGGGVWEGVRVVTDDAKATWVAERLRRQNGGC